MFVTGENYVGCFNDTHDRDLPEDHYEDPANTVDKCIIHCRSFGWQYAGVVSLDQTISISLQKYDMIMNQEIIDTLCIYVCM